MDRIAHYGLTAALAALALDRRVVILGDGDAPAAPDLVKVMRQRHVEVPTWAPVVTPLDDWRGRGKQRRRRCR